MGVYQENFEGKLAVYGQNFIYCVQIQENIRLTSSLKFDFFTFDPH